MLRRYSARDGGGRCPDGQGGFLAPLENATYLFRERPCGRLSRLETVNVPVEATQVEAKLAWGVLTVSSLKLERAKPKVLEVTAEPTTTIGPAVDAAVPNLGTCLPGGCLISNVSLTSTPCIGERSGMGQVTRPSDSRRPADRGSPLPDRALGVLDLTMVGTVAVDGSDFRYGLWVGGLPSSSCPRDEILPRRGRIRATCTTIRV